MAAQCATESLDNPLWQFAQSFYQYPDVENVLIELQDDHGADVLLLLAALWLASEWRQWPELEHQDFAEYLAWREHVVLPLRQVRRTLPGSSRRGPISPVTDFRSRVQGIELEAEQMGLAGLFALIDYEAPAVEPVQDDEEHRAIRQLARQNVQDSMNIDEVRVSSGQVRSSVHTLLLALDAYMASIPRQGQLWPDEFPELR